METQLTLSFEPQRIDIIGKLNSEYYKMRRRAFILYNDARLESDPEIRKIKMQEYELLKRNYKL